MTREEHTALEALGDKVDDLRLTVERHLATCEACRGKVDKHDVTLYAKDGIVAQQQTIREWKERVNFVERGLVGGVLRKVGELVVTAIVVWGVVFFSGHHSTAAVDPIIHAVK